MKKIVSLKIFVLITELASGGGFLDYKIPENAEKYGPIETKGGDITYFRYFNEGKDVEDKSNLVGVETFDRGVLVERNLFLDGNLHGIKKEWFRNGMLRSETPYENGKLNGLCRHWSENGKLVGSYMVKDGEGDVLVFQENGFLSKSESFRKNKITGWVVGCYDNGKIEVVNKISEGRYIFDYGACFYDTGSIRLMTLNSPGSKTKNGFIAYFTPSGKYLEKSFYLEGAKVDEGKYVEKGQNNSSLPKVSNDPKQCIELLNDEVVKVVEKYSDLEPVKIPLSFNEDGEIETVSGKPFFLEPS